MTVAAETSSADNREEQKRVIDIFQMVDADLDLQAKRILTSDLQLADLDLHLKLQDGLLTVSQLEFDLYGGHLDGQISLDGRRDAIDGDLDVRFDRLNVEKIIGRFGVSDRPFGRLSGELNLKVTGTSAVPADQRVFLPSIGRLDIQKSRLHSIRMPRL
ncbi:MAG: AsmA family protein [Desulfobacterales bacterium]